MPPRPASSSKSPASSSSASPDSSDAPCGDAVPDGAEPDVARPDGAKPDGAQPDIDDPGASARQPIKHWDSDDQPREKLVHKGARHLSDGELVALLLGSGTRTSDGTISAVELGRGMVDFYGGLLKLSRREMKELTRTRGVGPAKATTLLAAFEIARRIDAERAEAETERDQIDSPQAVARIYGPKMRDLKKEVFWVVHLNTANVIIDDVVVSEGGLSSSIVEPRAVFERAILNNAASVICLHNHPSGNPEPSRDDIRVTRQLVDAGQTMGIPVHDHIIIAGRTYTSLAERGIIS